MTDSARWSGWILSKIKTSTTLGDEARGQKRLMRRLRNQHFTLDIIKAEVRHLYEGVKHATFASTELDALIAKLQEGASNLDYRDRYNFLVRGLARGVRELGWEGRVPSQIHVHHAPKSQISARAQRQGSSYRSLLDIANSHFGAKKSECVAGKEGEKFSAQDTEAGQLIFSAITKGALLNANWLTALPAAVKRGVWIEECGVSLELQMADIQSHGFKLDVSKAQNIRRWFPDPITSMLLLRWYRRYGRTWPSSEGALYQQVEFLLKAFISSLPLPAGIDIPALSGQKHARPVLSRWLQDHACQEASKDFPSFLVHYTSSLDAGVSVPRETWLRLHSGLVARDVTGCLEQSERVPAVTLSGDSELPRLDAQSAVVLREHKDVLNALRGCLNHRKSDKGSERPVSSATKALTRFLEESENRSVILNLVARWLLNRLRAPALNQQKLRASSALRYLTTVGRPLLVASLENPNVADFDADDWTELYERAIHFNLSSEKKATRRMRLREFHDWLCKEFSVPQVDIEGEIGSARNVDANLLTPREYCRAKRFLGALPDKRQAAICSLVLTIGYRCGLRRREVTHLRLQDLEGLMEPGFAWPSLRVMNQRGLTQKSLSAVRRLPAWLLLTADELWELRRWVTQRRVELGGDQPSSLLFSLKGRPMVPIDNRDCFDLVSNAMRAASGDLSLKFHHNRHSFATILTLRLLETESGQLLSEQWVKDKNGVPILPHWGEDFSRLADLGRASAPTQKHLWELCTWCGHLTPGETMTSYSHLLDRVLASHSWRKRNPELSLEKQAQLLGVAASGIEKFRGRNKLQGLHTASDLLSALQKRWKPFAVKTGWFRGVLPLPPVLKEAEVDYQARVSPLVLYQMLSALEKMLTPKSSSLIDPELEAYELIAKSYDLPAHLVKEWAYRAELLAVTETDKKTPRLRFYRTRAHKPRALPESRPDYAPSLESFIAPPRDHRLKDEAEKAYQRLIQFYREEPELVLGVLAAAPRSFQRTKTQIKFKDVRDKINFIKVLDAIGLKKRAFFELVIAPERNTKKAKAYWVERLGITPSRIVIRFGAPGQIRSFRNGTVNVDFKGNDRGHRDTWAAVKFLLASAIILIPPTEMVGGVLGGAREEVGPATR